MLRCRVGLHGQGRLRAGSHHPGQIPEAKDNQPVIHPYLEAVYRASRSRAAGIQFDLLCDGFGSQNTDFPALSYLPNELRQTCPSTRTRSPSTPKPCCAWNRTSETGAAGRITSSPTAQTHRGEAYRRRQVVHPARRRHLSVAAAAGSGGDGLPSPYPARHHEKREGDSQGKPFRIFTVIEEVSHTQRG